MVAIPRNAVVSPDRIDQLLRAAVPEVKYEFDRVNRATEGILIGEKRLIMALLKCAVEDCRGGHRQPTMHKRCQHCAATAWIAGKCRPGWGWWISFEDVCGYLNLDPEAVRAEVVGKRKDAA